ncbi:MAG: hypothetical protein JRH19_12590 [Deltaproteobacteria bacterium]|nr:hypothetical protein [Deltaproteobacteria bacterium]
MMRAMRDAFSATRAADTMVGPFVCANGAVLVPVLALEVGLLQRGRGWRSDPSATAGAAELELLGVWIEASQPPGDPEPVHLGREDTLRCWLPAHEEPPDGASSWSSWLATRPELLSDIRLALEAAAAPRASTPG